MRPSWPLGLLLRLAAMGAAATVLGLLVTRTQYFATSLVVVAVLTLLFAELVRHATASDRELARVIDAIGQGDFADRPLEAGRYREDTPLAIAFSQALDRFRGHNLAAEADRARLSAVIEHAPVPLLAVEQDGRVELLNRAARRLFDRVALQRRADLDALAPELGAALGGPGGRRLVRLALPRGPQRCLVSVARSNSAGRAVALVSLQNIQGELDASEVQAWEELVRVLAHEIMNSLTPAASLAHTAALMIEDLRAAGDHPQEMAELAEAVDAIHRRSGGLIRFIEGYRRFAEPPEPQKRPVRVGEVLDRARRLSAGLLDEASVTLTTQVDPPELLVEADADLVDQALLNLVKNAIDAAAGSAEGAVMLSGGLDAAGRVVISVADSGPGLPEDLRERIFVPFFTTKAKGSGIGLSIVRQIMLGHGGSVEAVASGTGAVFRLTF